MLFDYCAECRSCCHIDPGYPPLEVSLTRQEKAKYRSICIDTECEHLSSTGCTLGDTKPLSCKLYPLAYNPADGRFHYDNECPLMPEYVRQLAEPGSDARQHLSEMKTVIENIQASEAAFLKRNFSVDKAYFELKELPSANVP
jgi:Fe-S-cluster containining protein